MKIRTSFVSNSSSSSFVIYGSHFEDLESIFRSFLASLTSEQKASIVDFDYDEETEEFELEEYEMIEILESFIGDLSFYNIDSSLYVGAGIDEMDDNETKKQFQDRIKEKIKSSLNLDKEPRTSWHEETIYDY